MYAAWASSEATPASKVSVVSTPCVDPGELAAQTACHATPRLEAVGELLGEDPPVAGVADGVEHGLADRDVVGLVEVATAPAVAEVAGDHDLGPVAPDHLGDRPPQRHAVLEDAVGEAEEVDHVDPDHARRLHLLGLADPARLVGMHAVDAGLPGGHHAVDDLLALAGPARDRGGGAELEVVGVRDDAEGAGPVFGKGLERLGFHGGSMPDIGLARRGASAWVDGCRRSSRWIPTTTRCSATSGRPSRRRSSPTGEHPMTRTWEALQNSVRDPSAYHRTTLLAAVEDGRVVGGADIGMPLQDNPHLGELEINVRPAHRRRGIGTVAVRRRGGALPRGWAHDAARRGERAGDRARCTAGMPFAESLGFASDHVEDHLVLALPVAERARAGPPGVAARPR